MGIKLRDIIDQVYSDLESNLNGFIEKSQKAGETWFTPVEIHDYAPKETDTFFMGIYLSSPSGFVYSADERGSSVDITLDCHLDAVWENGSNAGRYLSAVLDYLNRKPKYGVSFTAYTAVAMRADLGADVNGFAVALKVSIYDSDMDI